MVVHWLLQETNYHNDFNVAQRLTYLIPELGHKVTTFKYVPFGETVYDFMPAEGPVVYFGGWNVLDDIRRRGILTPPPFAWYDSDKFKCSTYYRKLGDYVAQQGVVFLKLEELTEHAYGGARKLFVRPDDNEKSFVGQLVEQDLCDAFVRNTIDYGQVSPDLDIVIALPQQIKYEWRVVVVDGKAISGSQYKEGKAIEVIAGCPAGVLEFAEAVAARWSPHPVFIVDVCETDEGYKVMEIGPFNYAGLYLNDLRAIVEAVNAHVLGDR